MSLCRTCEYALYDGMCLAHGKFTLLDAPACDDYKMHLDVEVSKLKAENAKLRELNESMWLIIRCATSHTSAEDGLPVIHEDDLAMLRSMRRDIGIEVDG